MKICKWLSVFFLLLIFIQSNNIFPQNSAYNRTSQPAGKIQKEIILKSYNAERAGFNKSSNYKNNEVAPVKYSPNYFRIDRSNKSLWNGKHWRVKDFPIKFYIDEISSINFKKKFREFVHYAFELWSYADERIKFTPVSSISNADLIITFKENLIDKYDENYLGITDYKISSKKEIQNAYVEISLLKFKDEIISDGEIKATIIHEIGHSLGLGHSDNDTDIMYPFINPHSGEEMDYDELSAGDIQAIRSVVNLGD